MTSSLNHTAMLWALRPYHSHVPLLCDEATVSPFVLVAVKNAKKRCVWDTDRRTPDDEWCIWFVDVVIHLKARQILDAILVKPLALGFDISFLAICIIALQSLGRLVYNPEFRDYEFMMTLSNGNIFLITGHLCGEFTGRDRWIPRTKASDVEFWCFL